MARFKILDHNNMIRFCKIISFFFLICKTSKADEFPTTISTANYYYTLFTSNFKTKLERLHNSYPNRKLTSYWQYSVSNICDTLYSHAYIPRTEVKHQKITIEIRITECGEALHIYYLELFFSERYKIKPDTQDELMKNLLQFKLPELDFNLYKKIKITINDNTLEWFNHKDQTIFISKSKDFNFNSQVELKQYSSIINGKKINHFLTTYHTYKDNSLLSSYKFLVNYQPLQDDAFPTIAYYDEAGTPITSFIYFNFYKNLISDTLNNLIVRLTNFDETLFNSHTSH